MEFVSTIEAFNELFEGTELGRFGIKILESDDFFVSNFVVVTRFVKEVNAGRISRVAVGDESCGLVIESGADGFVHGDGGG